MNKKITFLMTAMVLILAIMGPRSVAWGQTTTVTLTQSNLDLTGSYTNNTEKEIDGITYVYTDLMKNSDNIQAKASSGTIRNKTAYSGDIISVAITHSGTARATTILGSSDGTDFSQVATGSGSITADFSNEGYKYFKITRGSNAAYWTQIVITYSTGSPAVAAPTFSLAAGTYTEAQTVTIACATAGAGIYYTLDGTEPSNSSTLYNGTININETTTVKAIAYVGEESSDVATATYTIVAPLTTMNEIFAASAIPGNYYVTFNNWVVSGVKSSNAYITDGTNGTKGFIVYKSGHGFAFGDVLNGTVRIALTRYQGSAETTDLAKSTDGLTVTAGGTINPQVVNIADLSGVNTGAVITVNNVEFNGTNLVDESNNTIKPYNAVGYNPSPSLTNGLKYNVTGVYIHYNGNPKEISPRGADDIEEVVAPRYAINITTPVNGTVTTNPENETVEGATVTITATPAAHYELSTLSVEDESGVPIVVTNNQFTMPAEEVTISATFNAVPTYTISFTTNGVAETEATIVVNQGDAIGTLPEPTAANIPNGYTFRGWSANEVALTNDKPTYVTAETVPTGNMTLKAVFAIAETVEEVGNLNYSLEPNDFETGSYDANDGDKEINGITLTIKDVYKNSSSIQMKASSGSLNNKSALGQKITSVVVYVKTNSVKVYEGSTNNSWTEVIGSEGTYTFSDGNAYFKVTSTSKYAQVNSITVNYVGTTSSTVYSNYCTSVTALSGNLAEATTEANTAYYIREAATVEGEVTINGVLGNADASLLIINDGGQLICNNEVDATVKKSISAIDGDNGWYTIASPVEGSIDAPAAMTSSNEYDLYYYDEPEYTWRNYEYESHSSFHFQLANAQGYLYANRTATDIEFAGTLRAGNEVVVVDLSYESTYGALKGFNLVGNPFAHNIIMGTNAIMTNENTGYYVVENGANLVAKTFETPIKPCQGFMVQATGEDQTITFRPSAKETQTEHEYITIAAGNGDFMDMAYICTNADEKLGKITLDNPTAKVYLQQNGNDYAIAPLGEATSMVVCFKAPASGTYTINVSSDHEGVSLKDMKTGYVTAINHSTSYTFEAGENDAESRFKIMFGTTGVEENGAQMFVFQSGSNLIISGEGCVQIIDMMGRVLRTAQVESNVTVSTEGMTAGAYVVRMLTANGVQTQKVIVK